jgi:hypothetical protein
LYAVALANTFDITNEFGEHFAGMAQIKLDFTISSGMLKILRKC